MNDRLTAAVIGGWCVLWFAAAAAPGFAGWHRRDAGLPGGKRAIAAALCGSALPAFLSALCVVRAVWADDAPIWLHPEFAWRFEVAAIGLPALWIVSLGLIVSAGAAATSAAAPEPPRRRKEPGR
ncbi:hypothetical protein [Alienimonas sp. DA493]|uniref:hypothetical protein n=1 Tax=Alienimonas sp. DA493 TaxID=3373605 RepID=UPI00375489C6